MRTLSLLRHAKSSWDDERLADFDRPLAARGQKAAPLMGRHMRAIGLAPDLVLCSTARRTRETAALALPMLSPASPPVIFDEAIYEADWTILLARLQRVPGDIGHALVIGHNPGLQELALALAGHDLPAEHSELAEKLPTAALVVIELEIEKWERIRAGCGRIAHFMTPRRLEKAEG